jgi:pilin isopeptide linkage protein
VTVQITDAGGGKLNVTRIYLNVLINTLSWRVVTQNASLSRAKASTDDTETALAAASVYGADEDSEEVSTVLLDEPFVNAYHAAGSVTLKGTKKLTGNRKDPVKENEFKFTVKEVLTDEDGNEEVSSDPVATGYTEAGGSITFTAIPYTQADIGTTHTYKITEDRGSVAGVTYDTATAKVTVEVSDNGDGSLTANPTYSKGDGVTFTNTYEATGYVTLAGTKEVTGERPTNITKGEFTFSVKETVDEVTTVVATGQTLADSSTSAAILFTPASGALPNGASIKYTQDDIGTHTYEISEDKGNDTTIDYTTDKVTVTVKVSDNGDGTLSTEVEYPKNADGTDASGVKFVNTYHIPAPTGIRVDILPYIMMIAIAICLGMLLTICKRKRRSVRRR